MENIGLRYGECEMSEYCFLRRGFGFWIGFALMALGCTVLAEEPFDYFHNNWEEPLGFSNRGGPLRVSGSITGIQRWTKPRDHLHYRGFR
jgi:hypothetical protein